MHKHSQIQFSENFKNNLIFHLSHSVKITYSLYMAYELDLFKIISDKKIISLLEICELTGLCERSAQALISMCASMGLIDIDNAQCFRLSNLSQNFLDPQSPYYIGPLLSIHLENKGVILSYQAFQKAILTGKPQIYEGNDLFKTNEVELDKNIKFTKAMHAKSLAAAEFWPCVIDLSASSLFLDIGGGSGVHSIAAVKKWPHLKAIVFDRPEVCAIAAEYIEKEKLALQISLLAKNMWDDPYPKADVHFLCDILHDWPRNDVEFLIKKSFASLSDDGQIVILELLFDEKKDGPLSVSMSNLSMLMWSSGQQLSKNELHNLLEKSGFTKIEIFKIGFGDWSVAIAKKSLHKY